MRFGIFQVYAATVVATLLMALQAGASEVTRLPCGIDADQVHDRTFIVRFNEGVRSTSALEPYRGISSVSEGFFKPFGWGMTVVRVEPGVDMSKVFETLSNDPLVKDVWPNVIRTTSALRNASQFYPNDPRYLNRRDAQILTPDRQYYLELVNAPAAWEKTTGSESVTVAILDTGIDIFHEDLQTQYWVNAAEVPNDHMDNDGNGFIDDVYGYDFYLNRGLPRDDEPTTTYHGTSTAGIVGAAGGNNIGIMGAAGGKGIQGERGVRLMILRVGTDFTISLSSEIAALSYAVQMGANIVNMSFGGEPGGSAESDAVKAAWNAGLIIVAAAGNEGAGAREGRIDWPAAIPEAIAVGLYHHFPRPVSAGQYAAHRRVLGGLFQIRT
jgi:subtilisin family serine protease